MRPMILFLLFAAPILAQATTETPVDFMESWARWSRDSIKVWQETKVLHGNDLDRAKRLIGGVETKWTRLTKAGKVEELFDAHLRDDRLKAILALLDTSKKQQKIALQNLKSDLKAKLVAYTAQRQLLFEIGGDLESLRVLKDVQLKAAKDLKVEKKAAMEKHVAQLDTVSKAATAASQWCEGVEARITKLIGTIEEWLEALG